MVLDSATTRPLHMPNIQGPAPGPSRVGDRGESFPGPRDVWGARRRSKILKMVFQMASF